MVMNDPWLEIVGSFSLWAGSWVKAAEVLLRGVAGRSRSVPASGTKTDKEKRWGAGRRWTQASPLLSGSGQGLELGSHGGDEPRGVMLCSGIRSRTSVGLWSRFRHGATMQRRRDAAQRSRGSGRRSGDAGVRWRRGWLTAVDPWMQGWLGRALAFGPCRWLLVAVYCFFICFFSIVALSVITSNRVPVGGSGLCASGRCASLCTLCACFALGRRRVPCTRKWSLPLSSRVKLSVTGCSVQWQHDGKAVCMVIMLCCNRVADQVIFPSCHRCVTYVKANRDASCALFASWCLSGYMFVVETPVIISGCSLDVLYLGFRSHVPPMYSAVSLIKA